MGGESFKICNQGPLAIGFPRVVANLTRGQSPKAGLLSTNTILCNEKGCKRNQRRRHGGNEGT